MACLKLTYRSGTPTLKVVWNSLKDNQKGCTGAYRFGFQGMEKEDDMNGIAGTNYTTFWRQYDARIGRWLSVDPEYKKFAWQSPYVAFDNNPIYIVDPRGNSGKKYSKEKLKEGAEKGVEKATELQGTSGAACNYGVAASFEEITGSKELWGTQRGGSVGDLDGNEYAGQADDIGRYMEQSKDFKKLEGSAASYSNVQDLANKGYVVIGHLEGERATSGHLQQVVPGEIQYSESWNTKAPQVLETGPGRRESKTRASTGISNDDRGSVTWYVYKPALSNKPGEVWKARYEGETPNSKNATFRSKTWGGMELIRK